MKRIVHLVVFVFLALQLTPQAYAAPWEVLSDITYMRKGGVDAARIDFALPVHYVSHFPVKHGKILTINIQFSASANIDTSDGQSKQSTSAATGNKDEQIDISELPLLQTMTAPESMLIPLKSVTYMLENNEPKLVVEFSEDVNYSVSQVMGINNLVIFFPQTMKPDVVDMDLQPIDAEIAKVQAAPSAPVAGAEIGAVTEEVEKGIETEAEAGAEPEVAKQEVPGIEKDTGTTAAAPSEDEEKIIQILDEGRTALKRGDNKKAIQIFTKLLSIPEHKYMQASLELLGVARERNNQAAQAKAVYEEYLKKYPKGDGAIRVNQRLADLISSRSKPKKKLKETETVKQEAKPYTTEFYGSIAQYMDYSSTTAEDLARQTDAAILSNQLSLSQRYRSKDLDIRNFFYGNYDVDTVDGTSDGIEVGSLYSKINFKKLGLNATIGRQSASTAGVLGKFDGISAGYQVAEKIRINGAYGFPYDIFNKQNVQTSKPFYGGSIEFNEIWEGWDFNPYMFQQTADGVIDRTTVGSEVRYFKNDMSVFGLLDYDIYFGDLNIFLVNGTYNYQDKTSMSFSFDHRKNPNLETSNALIQLSEGATLDQLGTFYGYTEDEIKAIAEQRTGDSTSVSLGLSHEYNDKLSVTSSISYSRYTSVAVNLTATSPTDLDVLNTPSTTDEDTQLDYVVQGVYRKWLSERDIGIGYVRYTDATRYNEWTYSAAYRRPFGTEWRTNLQVQVRNRDNVVGDDLLKIIPSVKIDNRVGKELQLYLESSLEIWRFKGDSPNGPPDAKTYSVYFGYNWSFE